MLPFRLVADILEAGQGRKGGKLCGTLQYAVVDDIQHAHVVGIVRAVDDECEVYPVAVTELRLHLRNKLALDELAFY